MTLFHRGEDHSVLAAGHGLYIRRKQHETKEESQSAWKPVVSLPDVYTGDPSVHGFCNVPVSVRNFHFAEDFFDAFG